jgi:hypothetical protein
MSAGIGKNQMQQVRIVAGTLEPPHTPDAFLS